METSVCCDCHRPKAAFKCGICEGAVCKNCVQLSDDEALSFLAKIPPDLAHSTYCGQCHAQKVAPELEDIKQTLEKARGIAVYFINEGKKTRLIDRKEKPIVVKDCADKQETMLRLAFATAKAGYNAMVDVDIHAVKSRTNFYQTSLWQGSAVPVGLRQAQLDRE